MSQKGKFTNQRTTATAQQGSSSFQVGHFHQKTMVASLSVPLSFLLAPKTNKNDRLLELSSIVFSDVLDCLTTRIMKLDKTAYHARKFSQNTTTDPKAFKTSGDCSEFSKSSVNKCKSRCGPPTFKNPYRQQKLTH